MTEDFCVCGTRLEEAERSTGLCEQCADRVDLHHDEAQCQQCGHVMSSGDLFGGYCDACLDGDTTDDDGDTTDDEDFCRAFGVTRNVAR